VREEPVDQLTVRAAPLDPVTIADQHHTLPHRPSPGTPDLSVTPPVRRCGTSDSPGVSPDRGPVNGDLLLRRPAQGPHTQRLHQPGPYPRAPGCLRSPL